MAGGTQAATSAYSASAATLTQERLSFIEALTQRQLEQALPRIRASALANPGSPELQSLLGAAFIEAGEDEKAKMLLDTAVKYSPNSSLPYLFLGTLQANQGDLAGAEKQYEKAARLATDDLDKALIALAQGQSRFWQGDLMRATAHFKAGLARARSAPRLAGLFLQHLANLADLSGQPQAVSVLLRQSMALDPQGGAACQLLAYGLTVGRPRVATRWVTDEFVTQLGDSRVSTLTKRLLVRACVATGDVERARKHAIPLFASGGAPWPVDLSNVLAACAKLGPAANLTPPAADAAPSVENAYTLLWLGKDAAARKNLKSFLAEDAPSPQALFLGTVLSLRSGKSKAALSAAEKLYKQNDGGIPGRSYINLLLNQGQCADVVRLIDHRKQASLGIVKLRGLLRIPWIGAEQRQQALAVAALSSTYAGPWPEHLEMWRRLYRPEEAAPAGRHAWDDW